MSVRRVLILLEEDSSRCSRCRVAGRCVTRCAVIPRGELSARGPATEPCPGLTPAVLSPAPGNAKSTHPYTSRKGRRHCFKFTRLFITTTYICLNNRPMLELRTKHNCNVWAIPPRSSLVKFAASEITMLIGQDPRAKCIMWHAP